MNIQYFFEHWGIAENPFKAEEARQDNIFRRLKGKSSHPEYEKVVGDLSHPASAVVFGEKGSGKTAMRLQLQKEIEAHNEANSSDKIFMISYDDLNPILDRFTRKTRSKTTQDSLAQIRLVDHMDGILSFAVKGIVNDLLVSDSSSNITAEQRASLRKTTPKQKQEWSILQLLYDGDAQKNERGAQLRKLVRYRPWSWLEPKRWLSMMGFVLTSIAAVVYAFSAGEDGGKDWTWLMASIALAIPTLIGAFHVLRDRMQSGKAASLVSKELKVLAQEPEDFRKALEKLPQSLWNSSMLPKDDLDESRYQSLCTFRELVEPLGFKHIVVLIDRVDEPTLVNGDAEKMRAIIWPLFNNKFLQQPGYAFKMMLPIELRHELYRQSENFFQEARLDKQNMVDRLTWTGATLYDLCSERLGCCLEEGRERFSLTELFSEDVERHDLVDALEQMKQPRDAFKMMYQLIQDHCSNTTEEEESFKIPKLVLEQARRSQADRLDGLQRGYRPA